MEDAKKVRGHSPYPGLVQVSGKLPSSLEKKIPLPLARVNPDRHHKKRVTLPIGQQKKLGVTLGVTGKISTKLDVIFHMIKIP